MDFKECHYGLQGMPKALRIAFFSAVSVRVRITIAHALRHHEAVYVAHVALDGDVREGRKH